MEQTLTKVKNLEKFMQKHGEDPFFSQSISKMLDYKIQNYEEEIKRLNRELKKCERRYKADSSVFFKKFKEGRAGDDLDFIEWASLFQIRTRLLEKKTELEGKKIDD
ncbi:MAG: hypothetical protein AABY49_06580 [Planctomycetota bacterium]